MLPLIATHDIFQILTEGYQSIKVSKVPRLDPQIPREKAEWMLLPDVLSIVHAKRCFGSQLNSDCRRHLGFLCSF